MVAVEVSYFIFWWVCFYFFYVTIKFCRVFYMKCTRRRASTRNNSNTTTRNTNVVEFPSIVSLSREGKRRVLGFAIDKNNAMVLSKNMCAHNHNDIEANFNEDACIICLNEFNYNVDGKVDSKVIAGYCSHQFHRECLLSWVEKKNECPCCRTPVVSDSDYSEALAEM